jgi:hypothetical protein
MIYKATGNPRAIQILLGHTKIENTVRYLEVDIEDALILAERPEISRWSGPSELGTSRFEAGRLCAQSRPPSPPQASLESRHSVT